uniref:C2H2-type domain-containing protein n=1 Tax=Knipowitschia caucasica TaxID=637954 RepID=A0AAV2KSH8_KNICA
MTAKEALDRSDSSGRRGGSHTQPKCPECEQEFDGREELHAHMAELHGADKPISCPVCARSFTRNGSLKLHMAMHMREKPFTCPVCARGFTQKGNLRSHMAQHTGEKPFSCSQCDARFPIKRTLLRHMKLHTGERPYSCPYCDKSFTRKEHVRLHMSVHTGEGTPKKKRRVTPTLTDAADAFSSAHTSRSDTGLINTEPQQKDSADGFQRNNTDVFNAFRSEDTDL